ncbi:MAG: orotidine-5'-phosphate decarboxylase [Sulfurifustis sp.]
MRAPRVIVALDYAKPEEALAFVARVTPQRCRLKVGLELYSAAGPALVRELVARGFRVFLDLKFHDIPNTVERACRQAATLGVELLTVHCLGGRAMLAAARRGVGEAPNRPRVIGVTLLTSHDASDTNEIGLGSDVGARAVALAELGHAAGLDGFVCAPTEAKSLRRRFGADCLLVTPGVRPAGESAGDQQRVATPAQALADGASLLVIGRPITQAPDPIGALEAIEREIAPFN